MYLMTTTSTSRGLPFTHNSLTTQLLVELATLV